MALYDSASFSPKNLLARRAFLRGAGSAGLGTVAFNQLFAREAPAAKQSLLGNLAPKAKSVIFLHMVGAPSQLDLFDNKPRLRDFHNKPAPAELIEGKRFASNKGVPKLMASSYEFETLNEGQQISELLPHLKTVASEINIVHSMKADDFNHSPAQLVVHTGANISGRPGLGSWASYGLGSECNNLPSYVVMVSGEAPGGGSAMWQSGFLPSLHQGIELRSSGDPVLFLSNPNGVCSARRRRVIDGINELNALEMEKTGDPEIATRMAQYELAFKMQMSVPELTDIDSESASVREMYGEGDFAKQCLQARRLVERGVRFVELYDAGWDHHNKLDRNLRAKCLQTDQPVAALIKDLKMRGLLDETLVVWGSEFGRTPMYEDETTSDAGRDHHIDAFSIWMAGAGVRGGVTYGATDDFGYSVTEKPVHVRDLHATLLHALGIDHEQLTFPFQGLDQRLTGTEEASVHYGLFG